MTLLHVALLIAGINRCSAPSAGLQAVLPNVLQSCDTAYPMAQCVIVLLFCVMFCAGAILMVWPVCCTEFFALAIRLQAASARLSLLLVTSMNTILSSGRRCDGRFTIGNLQSFSFWLHALSRLDLTQTHPYQP
jgi:hypothetical protein